MHTETCNLARRDPCLKYVTLTYFAAFYVIRELFTDASDADAPTDIFTPGLTYFSRSHEVKT